MWLRFLISCFSFILAFSGCMVLWFFFSFEGYLFSLLESLLARDNSSAKFAIIGRLILVRP
jgi:hypothetical protein